MKSLRNHYRKGHLGWTAGDCEIGKPLDEESSYRAKPHDPLPHLQDLRPLADEHFKDHVPSERQAMAWREHATNIGEKHRNHVSWYKGDSSEANKPLRKAVQIGGILHLRADHNMPDVTTGHIKAMEHVTSTPTTERMNVYRGLDRHSQLHTLAPGDHFVDHGFTGTSLKRSSAHDFGGQHYAGDEGIPHDLADHHMLARIHVPAGTKGHYLDAQPNVHNDEHEFLLHRGTKFQVTGHSKSQIQHGNFIHKLHIIHMRVVGQNPMPIRHPEEEETDAQT